MHLCDIPAHLEIGDPKRAPTLSCSGRGLPHTYITAHERALLPHGFTLTDDPKAAGGLLSVALSVNLRPPCLYH